MKRWIVLAVAALGLGAGEASAQVYGTFGRPPVTPFSRPTVSPYINLGRGGAVPGISYYGLVRPQVYQQQSIALLQQQVLTQEQLLTQQQQPLGPSITGHATRFLDFSHYFPPTVAGVAQPRR